MGTCAGYLMVESQTIEATMILFGALSSASDPYFRLSAQRLVTRMSLDSFQKFSKFSRVLVEWC